MLALFHSHLKIRYTPRGGVAWILFLFLLLLVLVGPFLIAFFMGNFWIRHNGFAKQPDVTFTQRCGLEYTTVQGKTGLWSCTPGINIDDRYVLPYLAYKADATTAQFTLNVALDEGDAVRSLHFLPEFSYSFRKFDVVVAMTTAPLISFIQELPFTDANSTGPLFNVKYGNLLFSSVEPLSTSSHLQYATSPLQAVTSISELANLRKLASVYSGRDISTRLDVVQDYSGGFEVVPEGVRSRVTGDNLDDIGSFSMYITIHIPQASVTYAPSNQESLKWAWVQYFCIAYIVQWLLWWLRGTLVTMGLIQSIAHYDNVPRRA